MTLMGANHIIQFPGNYDWFRARDMTYVGPMGSNFMIWGSCLSPLLNVNRKLPACIHAEILREVCLRTNPTWVCGAHSRETQGKTRCNWGTIVSWSVSDLQMVLCVFSFKSEFFSNHLGNRGKCKFWALAQAYWVRSLEWCLWICVGCTRSSWHPQACHSLSSNNVSPFWVKISINYNQMYPYKEKQTNQFYWTKCNSYTHAYNFQNNAIVFK